MWRGSGLSTVRGAERGGLSSWMQLSVRFPEPQRPHLGQGMSPRASHSSLPESQGPLVPLPAWSPRRGKAAGASSRIPESTVPGLRGLANPSLSLGFPFLICKCGMAIPAQLPTFHPTFWSCGTQHFTPCLTVHPDQWVGTWPKLIIRLSWENQKLKGNQC